MSNSPDLHSPAAQPHAAAKAGAACPSRAAPATIPDDILETARKVLSDIDAELTMGRLYVVGRALQLAERKATDAERERCVQRWITYCSIQTEHGNHLGFDHLVGGSRAIRSKPEREGE